MKALRLFSVHRRTHQSYFYFICCLVVCFCAVPLVFSDESSESEKDSAEEKASEPDEKQEEPVVNTESVISIEQILDREATDKDYENTVRCIDHRRIRDYEVLSNRFVVVVMRNKEKYLIQLKHKCVGLRRGVTLRIERRGRLNQLCANDQLRTSAVEFHGRMEWGPPCRIPGFEPINDIQLDQLVRGIKSQRVE